MLTYDFMSQYQKGIRLIDDFIYSNILPKILF